MEIKFEDYLSEQERKQIVEDIFREMCAKKFKEDSERIFSNAAHATVYKIIDDMHSGETANLIAAKAIKLIDELSTYSVFRRADAWERGESEGYKSLTEAIKDNKQFLNDKIKNIIEGMNEDTIRNTVLDEVQILLDSKLFGKAA